MRCFYCKGETAQTTTKFIVDLGECVVIVKNVPGQVCRQCGETSFSNEVARELEKIVEAVKRSIMREVAIVDFAQVA